MKQLKCISDRNIKHWGMIALAILLSSLSIQAHAQQNYRVCKKWNVDSVGVVCNNNANNVIFWDKAMGSPNAWIYHTPQFKFTLIQAKPGQPAGMNKYEINACNQYCLFNQLKTA